MTGYHKLAVFLFLISLAISVLGQETIVKGKVTDAETGEPLPFASVYFNGTNIGVNTDFDGFFTLKANVDVDSVTATFFGYRSRTKSIIQGANQTLNFQLFQEVGELEAVVITPGENPAWKILRKVMDNKERNDKSHLTAYEYESFNKIEISIDNMSEQFQERKVMKEISKVFDSLKTRAGEDGKPVLPVFVSEAISHYYHRENPAKTKEIIQATKISGVGITDGTLASQLIGSSFQEYNFYKNWLNILEKDFISPIADEWKGYYEYILDDSMFIEDRWCYKMQ